MGKPHAVFCDGELVAIGDDIEDAVEKAGIPEGKEIFVKNLYSAKEQNEYLITLNGDEICIERKRL